MSQSYAIGPQNTKTVYNGESRLTVADPRVQSILYDIEELLERLVTLTAAERKDQDG